MQMFYNMVKVTIRNSSSQYPANCKIKTIEGQIIMVLFEGHKFNTIRLNGKKHAIIEISDIQRQTIIKEVKQYFINNIPAPHRPAV